MKEIIPLTPQQRKEKEAEHQKRVSNLYKQSHNKLIKYAYKLTSNMVEAEELVSNLYEYLLVKQNDKLFWGENTYNILYCNRFIYSRFINSKTRGPQYQSLSDIEIEDDEYDDELDYAVMELHNEILNELKQLERTKMWASAKIFGLYVMSDKSLQKVADDIGISKSTTFLAVKKIRNHLKEKFGHP
jgi:DNA-directed RNA polymerase specialized sigma24 family protein